MNTCPLDPWHSISLPSRRRGIAGANANAVFWATGNGLVSSTLVVYLALDLGATGIAISLILAAPKFAGLLRLIVPSMMARLRCRKAVCCSSYAASTVVLCMVPVVAMPQFREQTAWGLGALVVAWSLYHLLEYVAGVALWSWLGDLYPRRIRGRLLGIRQRWKIAGRVAGMVASVTLVVIWTWLLPDAQRWMPLALSAGIGALFLLIAVVPLATMPSLAHLPSAQPRAPWRTLLNVFRDRAYRRLLLVACWSAIVNGITAAAQGIYPRNVLGISYEALLVMRGGMRVGQGAISPRVGELVDRWGNRPIMVIAQMLVATGPLFYLAASADYWWILAGAYCAWVAYAGLNVGLDNTKLKSAAGNNNAPYLAVYHAVGDLAYGAATVAGGLFYDVLRGNDPHAPLVFAGLFIAGWAGRSFTAVLLARLIEPGAASLTEMFREAHRAVDLLPRRVARRYSVSDQSVKGCS